MECDGGDEQELTPNMQLWGQNAHAVEEAEEDEDEVTRLQKQLRKVKDYAWKRWKREYVHSLLESNRINRKIAAVPEI